jgi:hypothetical protein
MGLSIFVESDSNSLFVGISDASVAEMHLSGAWRGDGHHIGPQQISVVVRRETRRICIVPNESVVEVRVSCLQIKRGIITLMRASWLYPRGRLAILQLRSRTVFPLTSTKKLPLLFLALMTRSLYGVN